MLRRVVILADESAFWKLAGLRQLERVALEATISDRTTELCILWRPDIPPAKRFWPKHPRLTHCQITIQPPTSADLLLSTHLFFHRNSALSQLPSVLESDLQGTFVELARKVQARCQTAPRDDWEYLDNYAQSAACERRFLRAKGKSQDGVVSRLVNRPISRAVSRLVLKTPITPSGWTLAILSFPLVGAGFLARGDYVSIIVGIVFFQIYSILDGCDGEIARAKYQESPAGRQLDMWCDVAGNLLLATSLGYGLSRPPESGSFYWTEGFVVAALIATNELIIPGLAGITTPRESRAPIGDAVYPRHQQMIEQSGLLFFGERFAGWLIQLTKRDVAIVVFLFLALVGQPPWILHSLGTVAAISTLLSLKSRLR